VDDRPGIIATLAGILMRKNIGVEAVLQEPGENRRDLPFVIVAEPTYEHSMREALLEMAQLDFMKEAPLALPMETSL
jgi:homoserine dehydrogenase